MDVTIVSKVKLPLEIRAPLVESPRTLVTDIPGTNYDLRITLHVSPRQYVHYEAEWLHKPRTGLIVLCEGNVFLKSSYNKRRGRRPLSKVCFRSNGDVFPQNRRISIFELEDMDDFDFYGKFYEQA